jgi:hypothetical protein
VCLTNEVSEKLAKYGILFEKSCQNGFLQKKKKKEKKKKKNKERREAKMDTQPTFAR